MSRLCSEDRATGGDAATAADSQLHRVIARPHHRICWRARTSLLLPCAFLTFAMTGWACSSGSDAGAGAAADGSAGSGGGVGVVPDAATSGTGGRTTATGGAAAGSGGANTGAGTGGAVNPPGSGGAGPVGSGGSTAGGTGGRVGSGTGGGASTATGGRSGGGASGATGGGIGTGTGGGSPPDGGVTGATTTVVATSAGGLTKPTDLDFNPYKMGELWVTNFADNSMTIIADATRAPMAQRRRDSSHAHFMALPMGISFGGAETTVVDAAGMMVRGTFATCGDFRNGGDDFMGPVLWTSDLRIFAVPKAMREPPFNGAMAGSLGSHLDMLHLSPLCTGISWEGTGNFYWTYSGVSKAFVRYDFRTDHWIGHDDHSNGAIWRYGFPGQLGYIAGVPSHLVYRVSEKAVYFADTGNGRVVKFLPSSSTANSTMRNLDGLRTGPSLEMTGTKLTDVVAKGVLQRPSGLHIQGEVLLVTDNATGIIHKFSVDGVAQGSVQTDVRPGGLAGITVGPDEKIYVVDMLGNRVLRLESGL